MVLSFVQEIETLQTEERLSIIELIRNSGVGGVVIISILFLLLMVVVFIYFERLLAVRYASKIDANFMPQIRTFVVSGKLQHARNLCISENSPIARLILKGLSRIGRPLQDLQSAIENAGRIEVYKLEQNVSVLATIAGVAPMIGFLGTVVGMILSIFEISNAGGNIDMQLLSNGLYTAMTTTVAGLIVGIIAYITYNHLVTRTNKVVYRMESTTLDFLDLLNEPS